MCPTWRADCANGSEPRSPSATKVERGTVEIRFFSDAELNRLLETLGLALD